MIYVTSDLHGYSLEKFKLLLKKADFSADDFLFVLGDVIDRGNEGIELLNWMMLQPNVQLILGNHEAMLLACSFLFDELSAEALDEFDLKKLQLVHVWKENGSSPTLEGLKKLSPEQREYILEYVREAPLYDSVSAGGKDFLLVHGGLGGYSPDKKISDYTDHDLLWTRPALTDRYSSDFITVIGHTPTCFYGQSYKGRMINNGSWINIDTGASSGYAPMLLRLDDLTEFYADEQ